METYKMYTNDCGDDPDKMRAGLKPAPTDLECRCLFEDS